MVEINLSHHRKRNNHSHLNLRGKLKLKWSEIWKTNLEKSGKSKFRKKGIRIHRLTHRNGRRISCFIHLPSVWRSNYVTHHARKERNEEVNTVEDDGWALFNVFQISVIYPLWHEHQFNYVKKSHIDCEMVLLAWINVYI
jgi:hypothetical protein